MRYRSVVAMRQSRYNAILDPKPPHSTTLAAASGPRAQTAWERDQEIARKSARSAVAA